MLFFRSLLVGLNELDIGDEWFTFNFYVVTHFFGLSGWMTDPNSQSKSRCFNCRLLVKPLERQGETMEESQQRVLHYENMQISAVLFPRPGDRSENSEGETDGQNYLICISRRIPSNEKNSNSNVEQFTTRLDPGGKITAVDTRSVWNVKL